MSKPARHHFVPQMLLKNFCDDDGTLWYFDKSRSNFRAVKRHPRSVFFSDDYYAVPLANGETDFQVEADLSRLEKAAALVIDKICKSARKGRMPGLAPSEKRTWSKFVFSQWKRTPDSMTGRFSLDDVREWVTEDVAALERLGVKVDQAMKADVLSNSSIERMLRGARARNAVETAGNVEALVNDMGIFIAHIPRPNKAFVISSHPVVKLHPPGHTRLGAEGVELWLPLASDVAVSAMPATGERTSDQITDLHIRGLNLALCRQSRQVGGKSQRLIQSLIANR